MQVRGHAHRRHADVVHPRDGQAHRQRGGGVRGEGDLRTAHHPEREPGGAHRDGDG